MPSTPYGSFTRRALVGLALAAAASPAVAQSRPRVVTILGDSITAGYGLPSRDALPARLEVQLKTLVPGVRVRGAGVSGDTTAGGLARVDFSVQPDTSLCIVALGGNDLLQGLDPQQTRANLDRILARLKARRIPVLLVGLTPPNAIGRSYARDFAAVYAGLARKHGVPLYPNLLDGVRGVPRLNQRDGIHPNAAGVNVIVGKLAPVAARALR
ncbi:arylesterase [Caulobacter mirabilis]|uniref:Arylesterase n=1 Tax=Caulobacter mirabilis TaxID=69666 RepID=A0A2D2B2H2_9CAUL|nr:arylesterase [Caulobacter mirabilis]ATQ44463.1 arylesterase [Caulobacter mirabilis]